MTGMSIALRSMGVVADRTGEAGIPGPIVVGESSQNLNKGWTVKDVEAQRSYPPGVESMLRRSGQSVAQSVQHRPEIPHRWDPTRPARGRRKPGRG